MNETFEELKLRAVREADVRHIDFYNLNHTEIQILGDAAVEKKLVELVVQECVKIAYQHDIAKFTKDGFAIGQEIEKHFGVK